MKELESFREIVRTEVPLALQTWLQLGGAAEYFAEPTSEEQLASLLAAATAANYPIRVLGQGSNVLAPEEGVRGLVVRLTDPCFCNVTTEGDCLTAGGGTKLGRVVTTAAYSGLAGLEAFVGIPGSVGGAVYENITTTDGHLGQYVESVHAVTFDGRIVDLTRDEIAFGYRSCSIENAIILSVRFRLEQEDAKELSRRLQKIWIVRKKLQPMGYQNSGRLFKNPRGENAAELIESVGLSRARIGGAALSARNCNYVVVEPECCVSDVLRLIDLIRNQVAERLEVELELELEIWKG
ncbi:MAG: UDP-N-acetylmuramate dehydrogenase [Planctomycetia bacterium]|nr:UDP-N-acetylmuramate dehydrogenase [Planctomycetia bacterium]